MIINHNDDDDHDDENSRGENMLSSHNVWSITLF